MRPKHPLLVGQALTLVGIWFLDLHGLPWPLGRRPRAEELHHAPVRAASSLDPDARHRGAEAGCTAPSPGSASAWPRSLLTVDPQPNCHWQSERAASPATARPSRMILQQVCISPLSRRHHLSPGRICLTTPRLPNECTDTTPAVGTFPAI